VRGEIKDKASIEGIDFRSSRLELADDDVSICVVGARRELAARDECIRKSPDRRHVSAPHMGEGSVHATLSEIHFGPRA